MHTEGTTLSAEELSIQEIDENTYEVSALPDVEFAPGVSFQTIRFERRGDRTHVAPNYMFEQFGEGAYTTTTDPLTAAEAFRNEDFTAEEDVQLTTTGLLHSISMVIV